jgi:hypothetical protein
MRACSASRRAVRGPATALPRLTGPGPRAEDAAAADATGSLFEDEDGARPAPSSPPSPDDPGPYGDPLEEEDPEQVAREFQGNFRS